MHRYTTPRDGIVGHHSLTAPDLPAARATVQTSAWALYGPGFTFCVRPA